MKKLKETKTLLILISFLISCSRVPLDLEESHSFRSPADDTFSSDNAYEVYNELRRMQFTRDAQRIAVRGGDSDVNNGVISYGGEKEGSTSRVTKVFGPTAEHFENVVREMGESGKRQFLIFFLEHLSQKKLKRVETISGESIEMSYRFLKNQDFSEMETEELYEKFKEWTDKTQGKPFSFLQLSMRRKIFDANVPGFDNEIKKKFKSYSGWAPLFGEPEKYLDQLVSQDTIDGWEILTKPQYSYGEHEAMIKWFKKTLGTKNEEFQAPGHQRILWPRPNLSPEEMVDFQEKLAGTYRLAQALIVLHGIAGKTGINFGHWKFLLDDQSLWSLNLRRNDVFRLEQNRFVEGAMSLEMRAGTKDVSIQRFIQQMITARVASGDFSGIADISEWNLIPRQMTAGGFPGVYDFDRFLPSTDDVASKYSVDQGVVDKAFNNIKNISRSSSMSYGDNTTNINIRYEFWVPFWNWSDAPFLSKTKKGLLKSLTKSFLESVAALDNPSEEQIQRLFQDWVRVSELDVDLKNELMPKKYPRYANANPHEYKLSSDARVDVNKVHLGIEYSASFPLDNKLLMSDEMEDGKNHWRLTTFDLTDKERETILSEYATNLGKELGVEDPKAYKISEDGHGHGHGLDVAYAIRDRRNREWRVEWDGIGRSYSPGKKDSMSTSKRGGHIEIVTPKFKPKMSEIDAVYRAMEETDINPAFRKGGSHINIDLAVFDNKPKELARFLAIFHEYRSIIALMYQHPNRRNAAEAVDLNEDFARKLASFNGSELELKQLLYDNQYFNTRLGRKTRYVQFDASAYFQDIIPDEFISEDFDIANPWVAWRRQFRVNPKIRKLEGRLFGAPENSLDGALQQKLVRAMMNKALNSDDAISGQVQDIKHEDYLKNPAKAYEDLKKLTDDLGLDYKEYEMWTSRGLEYTEAFVESDYYRSFEEKNKLHPKMQNWKESRVDKRSTRKTNQLRKRVIRFDEEELEPRVREFMQNRQAASKKMYQNMHQVSPLEISRSGLIMRKKVKRLPSCSRAIKLFFQ